jgi:hypothetical protein
MKRNYIFLIFSVINLAKMTGRFGASLNCRKEITAINIQETLKCGIFTLNVKQAL